MRSTTGMSCVRRVLMAVAPVLLAASGAWASEEGGEAGGLPPFLQPNAYLAFWTLVVFGLLLFVLGKFAWKPLLEALQAREKHIQDSIQDVARANAEAKRLLGEHEKKMAEVQNEVRAIIDEARRDAQHTQQEIVKQAQVEAQAARDRATREIDQAKDHALQEIFHRAADVATEVAGQILRRSMNPQDHRDLVQQAIKDLPSRN